MTRKIFDTQAGCNVIAEMENFISGPLDWLRQQMEAQKLTYLLAHADDGVIWGRLLDGQLKTAHEVTTDAASLCLETLQTVRVFGPGGELLIWRDDLEVWMCRLIAEPAPESAQPTWTQAFDEHCIMWGTQAEPQGPHFTLMSEGTQGIKHCVPLPVDRQVDGEHRPLRLIVRHYVAANENGFLQIAASRLYDLRLQAEEESTR